MKLNPYKPVTRVKFIKSTRPVRKLTAGKIYDVMDVIYRGAYGFIKIYNDHYLLETYSAQGFERVK